MYRLSELLYFQKQLYLKIWIGNWNWNVNKKHKVLKTWLYMYQVLCIQGVIVSYLQALHVHIIIHVHKKNLKWKNLPYFTVFICSQYAQKILWKRPKSFSNFLAIMNFDFKLLFWLTFKIQQWLGYIWPNKFFPGAQVPQLLSLKSMFKSQSKSEVLISRVLEIVPVYSSDFLRRPWKIRILISQLIWNLLCKREIN